MRPHSAACILLLGSLSHVSGPGSIGSRPRGACALLSKRRSQAQRPGVEHLALVRALRPRVGLPHRRCQVLAVGGGHEQQLRLAAYIDDVAARRVRQVLAALGQRRRVLLPAAGRPGGRGSARRAGSAPSAGVGKASTACVATAAALEGWPGRAAACGASPSRCCSLTCVAASAAAAVPAALDGTEGRATRWCSAGASQLRQRGGKHRHG